MDGMLRKLRGSKQEYPTDAEVAKQRQGRLAAVALLAGSALIAKDFVAPASAQETSAPEFNFGTLADNEASPRTLKESSAEVLDTYIDQFRGSDQRLLADGSTRPITSPRPTFSSVYGTWSPLSDVVRYPERWEQRLTPRYVGNELRIHPTQELFPEGNDALDRVPGQYVPGILLRKQEGNIVYTLKTVTESKTPYIVLDVFEVPDAPHDLIFRAFRAESSGARGRSENARALDQLSEAQTNAKHSATLMLDAVSGELWNATLGQEAARRMNLDDTHLELAPPVPSKDASGRTPEALTRDRELAEKICLGILRKFLASA